MEESRIDLTEEAAVTPFDEEADSTLIDEMLSMKISDRLRMLSRYVNAVQRFRRI